MWKPFDCTTISSSTSPPLSVRYTLAQSLSIYGHAFCVDHQTFNCSGNLSNLTSLDVKDNRLKELPPEIGYLKNLKELLIDGNKLNALPAEFDEIEDSIELFTYDNNPFSTKLLNFEDDDDLDANDVRGVCAGSSPATT